MYYNTTVVFYKRLLAGIKYTHVQALTDLSKINHFNIFLNCKKQ